MDKKQLQEKAYEEFKEYVLITLYLWVILGLFVMYKAVITGERVSAVAHGVALLNAVVLSKFMLLAKAFHFGAAADNAPLIYPTVRNSAVYAVVVGIFKILEEGIVGYFHGKSFSESIFDLSGGAWSGLFIMTLMLFVVFLPFVGFGELQRVLGPGKLSQLFLRSRDVSKPFGQQAI
jgi:hypothetical protein